jgi:hypothetical protein
VQPNNANGIRDGQNEREPWIELYNSGPVAVSLDGFYLAKGYEDIQRLRLTGSTNVWPFPFGSQLLPGEFKIVWADGETGQSTANEWHTSFRLDASSGSVALARVVNNQAQIMDYLNYSGLGPDLAYGSVPDGQPFDREVLYYVTAGTNNFAPPVTVFINEWMASNTGALTDPADGHFDDWFELYNPTASAADLAGYYLTDNLGNKTQFRIPAGYNVPARGYLLVWADNEPAQNTTNHLDLHTSFQLSKNGEAIGLFAPDGTQIDAVTFGPQTNNISEGRYPDGAAQRYFMPTPTPRAPNITGRPAPEFLGITSLPNGDVTLTVQTIIGKVYRIEFKNQLNDAEWTQLGADIPADSTSLAITDNIGLNPQRFYRIVQVE